MCRLWHLITDLAMWHVKLGLSLVVLVAYIHQSSSLPETYSRRDDPRELSPEETEVANKAREEIAKILKKNIIRFLAAVTVEERHRQQRQFPEIPAQPEEPQTPLVPHQQSQQPLQAEDEDEDDDSSTNKPTEKATRTPQEKLQNLNGVASILGAIFSSTLNLTSVVDRAFFLLPNALRSQFSGVFKVITGHPIPGEFSTPLPLHKISTRAPTTIITTTQMTTEAGVTEPLRSNETELQSLNETTVTSILTVENSTSAVFIEGTTVPTKATTKERVTRPSIPAFGSVFNPKRRGQGTTSSAGLIPLGLTKTPPNTGSRLYRAALPAKPTDVITEEEISQAEKEIVEDAKLYVRFTKGKQQVLLEPLQQIIYAKDFNMTAVEKTMPDLFMGARKLYSVLQSLGQFVGLVDES